MVILHAKLQTFKNIYNHTGENTVPEGNEGSHGCTPSCSHSVGHAEVHAQPSSVYRTSVPHTPGNTHARLWFVQKHCTGLFDRIKFAFREAGATLYWDFCYWSRISLIRRSPVGHYHKNQGPDDSKLNGNRTGMIKLARPHVRGMLGLQ